jgi:carboxylesterase type B
VAKKKRPVLVWLHGGNFVRGSAAEYDPDYILDEDVVLVTVNYRLGMFGFLSTEDEVAPGNYGMMDQVAALQWVRKNIESFSGDPNRITILGQQAGGASVHYHLLSPLTRGLFNQAVSLSGSALCWWASLKRPLEKTLKLARLLECKDALAKDGTGDSKKMMECFRSKTMEELMNTHPNFYEWRHLEQCQEPVSAWSPRVDPESRLPYLPAEPIDLMKQGNFQHVPWIIGLTDDEGAFKASAFLQDMKAVREFEAEFEKLGPLMFGLHDGQSEAPKVNAAKVRDYYWGATQPIDQDTIHKLVHAISDSSYSHPIDTASKIHAMQSKAPVYVYHFGYRGANTLTQLDVNSYPPKVVDKDVKFGVGNGDDLIYLFPILSGTFRPLPHDDLVFSQRFVELLVSFARDGVPSIDMGEDNPKFVWNPVLATNATHLDIGNEMKMDAGLPNHERMSFWQQMPVYWNSNRMGYKPAPPIVWKDEL